MEIILLKDLDELGLEGDIVKVADGYARNYLIPRGIAFEATPQNVNSIEQRRKKIELRKVKAKEEAEQLKEQMSGVLVQLSQKAGEEGKLYGSVTSMDIAEDLEKQGIVIDRRKIMLDKPIKVVGEYDVPVKIYPEVVGSIKVVVSPKEEGE
ncbi:MAG: 50S ribosomal protein L9 [Thermoplasmata archaeon]|nr:MAG: 50S ribosomal protein L9 [Deltaproteobacteria bacterium]RLF61848.1 MAG: 50S ribosomal protein L9 [Thermoplasmata archaeon]